MSAKDHRVGFDRNQKYTPFYIRVEGKKRYFKTEALAVAALAPSNQGMADMRLGPRAVAEYRSAKSLLPPGTSLVYVAEQFMKSSRLDPSRTVGAAIDEYVAAREADPQLRPRYIARVRQLMRWFKEVAGTHGLSTVSHGDVEEWCLSRGSAHRQHEARTHLSVFFSFCLRRQWIDRNPADSRIVTLHRKPAATIGFMPVDTARALLAGAWEHARDLVAPFALQMFCGVRTEEVIRLSWEQVAMDVHVDITPTVSKTGERRVIDWWPDNLTSWLKPVRAETGLVAPRNYSVRRALLTKQPKLELPHNAFRHSSATYGVAFHQDAARISLMLGHHDRDLVFRHYRGYATLDQGRAYFSIAR
jgi:integrase